MLLLPFWVEGGLWILSNPKGGLYYMWSAGIHSILTWFGVHLWMAVVGRYKWKFQESLIAKILIGLFPLETFNDIWEVPESGNTFLILKAWDSIPGRFLYCLEGRQLFNFRENSYSDSEGEKISVMSAPKISFRFQKSSCGHMTPDHSERWFKNPILCNHLIPGWNSFLLEYTDEVWFPSSTITGKG